MKAKARWILLGHKDPDVLEMERFSPTPATPTVMLALQILSSMKYKVVIMDVTSAFGQSDPQTRPQGISTRQCQQVAYLGDLSGH